MDTKSKSSNKVSFLTAGIWIALSVIVFMAFYPVFKREAANYYTDILRSDQLLQQFYQSDLVLYKGVWDKRVQGQTDYADLYLVIQEEKIPEAEFERLQSFETEWSSLELRERIINEFNQYLESLKENVLDGIAKSADYCVIDHETGEIQKNTGRGIEKLFEDKKLKNSELPYVYYIMLTYDDTGNLSHVSVRDERPDELLKNLQSAMGKEWLKSDFAAHMGRTLFYQNTFNFYEEQTKLSYHVVNQPENVTFIYALTQEQKDALCLLWNGNGSPVASGYQHEIMWAYERAGVVTVLWCILAVLGVAALLATRGKAYCLHRMKAFQLHLEISLFSLFCLFGGFYYLIVGLVSSTNSGWLSGYYKNYLGFVPQEIYPALTIALNVAVLTLYFGAWYYFATSLGEVFELGPKQFLKERSLLIKAVLWFKNGCKKRTDQFKEEILHVDLGQSAEKTIRKLVIVNFLMLAATCMMWMFGWGVLLIYSVILYIALKQYIHKIQEQYQKLFAATRSIAEGNLQTELEEDWGVFESYKAELSKIQNGFKMAVDEEVKSQRMKTELLTNVSHDLKTPLTAITTYIELLETENLSPQQRAEYLDVLKKKSQRLKFLIEDLFEVSKATSGNITFHPVDVDICNLMRQVYLEYEDRVEEADLVFRFRMPEEKVVLQLDSQKTYRIFENLYTNIIKYAMSGTRVYVNAEKTEKGIRIELKNVSAVELNLSGEDLTERFVRGDSARNTEGSGLGLAIATSFVELQGGKMKVEVDGDLFKVKIEW